MKAGEVRLLDDDLVPELADPVPQLAESLLAEDGAVVDGDAETSE